MTEYRQPEGIAEFAEELRLLAEAVLERVEPVLREAATNDKPEWGNCTWCPLCAAAALVRGEQHEVLATVAAHGTAIVTILREALAGEPVDPVWSHAHGPGPADAHDPSASDTPHPDDATGPAPTPGEPGADTATADAEPAETDEPSRRRRAAKKSRYVGIPVTIKR